MNTYHPGEQKLYRQDDIATALMTIVRAMVKEQDRYRIILLNDLAVSGPTGF